MIFMTNEKTKIELKRVNINLPINLIERVKDYADSLGLNTTSAYIVLLNQALDQKQSLNSLPAIVEMYQTIMPLIGNNPNELAQLNQEAQDIKIIEQK